MCPREILRLRSSEITQNVYFAIYFASSKHSKRATKLYEMGYVAGVFEKWGACAPCTSHIFLLFITSLLNLSGCSLVTLPK